jgi:hypothetical protein
MISTRRNEDRVCRFAAIASMTLATIIGSSNWVLAQRVSEEIKRFELHIEKGRLTDSSKTIRVMRDDEVEITWHADRPTAVHLHGYDIEITADPKGPQIMSFKARATGRFAIESHGGTGAVGDRHSVLIYLEVHPR